MYISNGINTNGIKTNFFTGINCKMSNLTCNYANVLQLYTNEIILKGDITITGNTYLGNTLVYSSEVLDTSGSNITFTEIVTWLDATSGNITVNLPIATEDNLLKIITLKANANGMYTAIVEIASPGTFLNSVGTNTKATFTAVGQSLTLISLGNKWAVLSNNSSVTFS